MKTETTDWSITAEEQLRRIVAALRQENTALKGMLEANRKQLLELKERLENVGKPLTAEEDTP